jgi:hypothetical protein
LEFVQEGDRRGQVRQLLAFMVYCFEERHNSATTVQQKLAALQYFHRTFAERKLPTRDDRLQAALAGMARVAGEMERPRRPRRLPLSWRLLLEGRECEGVWAQFKGGQTVWFGLALSFFFLTRASEIWRAEGAVGSIKRARMEEYVLRRSDLSFWKGKLRLCWEERAAATMVRARFRVSKADQLRKGKWVQRGGTALRLVLELLDMFPSLPLSAPLTTYVDVLTGEQVVVSRAVARKALVAMARAGGVEEEEAKRYQLHSGRIGGATAMAAKNLSPAAIMIGGRWAGDSWRDYVQPSDEMAAAISAALEALDT